MQICRINNSTFKSFVWSSRNKICFCLQFWKLIIFNCSLVTKGTCFFTREKKHIINLEERQLLPHYWWDKVFKGMVVNRALSSLSLKITLTVPLRQQLTLLDEYFNLISAKNGIITMSFELKHGNQCRKYFSRSFLKSNHLFLHKWQAKHGRDLSQPTLCIIFVS